MAKTNYKIEINIECEDESGFENSLDETVRMINTKSNK